MSRHEALRVVLPTLVLAIVVAVGVSACVFIPIGGRRHGPVVAIPVPAPPVVIAPGPPVYGYRPYYGRRWYW